ncbi:MAG TPA: universal stress protein [Fimbriimonadaceae bacterium]|nr:universal stress protein [Fimbriimonadaceae bacterium]HRJ32195.1 universal stress protein [Fimbriimonadaceae bacterium]
MKVILGTDGSETALFAEKLLTQLVLGLASEIVVVSVLTPPVISSPIGQAAAVQAYATDLAQLYDELKTHTRKVAEDAAGRLRASGLDVRVVLREGDPGSEIQEVAEAERADWIIIGSRGENALTAMLMGSVARKLISRSTCSVLVVHAPEDAKAADRPGLSAVVGVENEANADDLTDWVARFGSHRFNEIVVVCAEPAMILPPSLEPVLFMPPTVPDLTFAESVADHAAQRLAGVTPKLSKMAVSGRPANVLIDTAREHQADLIFLTAKRHGALERILIGSVSYEVATTAPCSVFIHRPRGEAQA